MVVSIDAKGLLKKKSPFLHGKSLEESRYRRNVLNTIKAIYNTPTANIALNETLKVSLLKPQMR